MVDMVVCSTMEKIFIFLLVSSAIFSAVSVAHRDKYVKHRNGYQDHQNKKLAKLAYILLKLIDEKNHRNSNDYHHSAPIQRYHSLDNGFSGVLPSLNPFLIHKNKYAYKNRRSGSQEYKAVDEATSISIDDFLSKTTRRKAENPAYGVKDFVKDVLDELLPSLHEHGNKDSDETILEILVEHSGGNRKKIFSKKIPNTLINNGGGFEDLSVIPLRSREYNKYHHAKDGYGIQNINSKESALANDATLIDTKYGTRSHWGGYSTGYIYSKNSNSPETGFVNNKYKWEPDIKVDTNEISMESKLRNAAMNGGSYEKSYKNKATTNWSNFNQVDLNEKKQKSHTYKDYLKNYFKSNSNNKYKDSLQQQSNYYNPYLDNYDFYYPENKEQSPEKINSENVFDSTNTNISDSYVSKDRIIEILDHYKQLLLDAEKDKANDVKMEKKKQQDKFVLPVGHFDRKYIVNNLFGQKSYETADKLDSDYNSGKYYKYGDSSEKYYYANELAKNTEEKYYKDNSEKYYYDRESDQKYLRGKMEKKTQQDKFVLPYDKKVDKTYLINYLFDQKSYETSDKLNSDNNSEKYYKYGDSSGKYYYANELAKKKLYSKDKYYNDNYGKYHYDSSEKYYNANELAKNESDTEEKYYNDNSKKYYYDRESNQKYIRGKMEKKKQHDKFVLPSYYDKKIDKKYLINHLFDQKSYETSDKLNSDNNSEKYYKYGDSSGKYYYANELAKKQLYSKDKYYNDNYGKYYYYNSEKFYYGNELDKMELAGKDKYYNDNSQNHYYDSESDQKYLGGEALGNYYGPYLSKNYETEKSLEVSEFDHIGDYNANAQIGHDVYGSYKGKYSKPNYYADVGSTYVDAVLQPFEEKVKVGEPQYIDYYYPPYTAYDADKFKSIESKIPNEYELLGTYGADKSKTIESKELGLSGKVPAEGKYELMAVYDKDQINESYFDNTQPLKLHNKDALRSREVDVGKSKHEAVRYYEVSPEDLYQDKPSVYEEKPKDKKKKICKKGKKTKKKCKKCKKVPTLEGVMFAFRYKPGTKDTSISIKSDTAGKPNIAVEVNKTGVKHKRAVEKAQDYKLYQHNARRYGYTGANDYQPYDYVDEAAYAPYARTYGWT